MTLDEAIRHCEDVAAEQKMKALAAYSEGDYEKSKDCIRCSEEHRQLANWLKELKTRREADHNLVKKIAESTMACGED